MPDWKFAGWYLHSAVCELPKGGDGRSDAAKPHPIQQPCMGDDQGKLHRPAQRDRAEARRRKATAGGYLPTVEMLALAVVCVGALKREEYRSWLPWPMWLCYWQAYCCKMDSALYPGHSTSPSYSAPVQHNKRRSCASKRLYQLDSAVVFPHAV
jgi:hypothetical protein